MKMRQFFTRRTGGDRISLRFRKHEGPYLRSEEIHWVAILKRGLGVAMRQKLIKELADLREITDWCHRHGKYWGKKESSILVTSQHYPWRQNAKISKFDFSSNSLNISRNPLFFIGSLCSSLSLFPLKTEIRGGFMLRVTLHPPLHHKPYLISVYRTPLLGIFRFLKDSLKRSTFSDSFCAMKCNVHWT